MRFLVPAASTALIVALFLSATAVADPATGTRSAPVGFRGPTVPGAPVASGISKLARAHTLAAHAGRGALHGGFVWPLSPRPAVLRRFERPQNHWAAGHRGVDLSAAVGQPVLSAGEGVVAFSGVISRRGVITVRHPGGLRTTYDPVDERLATGAVVHRGNRIGVLSPAPGHCAPRTCLHWGAISERAYRDPLSLLGFGRPILLPLG
jgi:murein DD-endopeptidase MepM/ murein hydrolase activator NlpD